MQYRVDKKSGRRLSVLGLGCMRFPKTLGNIDMGKAESIVLASVEKGINYFDTAWMYMGNEEALGAILEKNKIRDKVYIATKLPSYLIGKPKDFDHFFYEELKRLRTDHIDYYLMHNLPDLASWNHLVKLGVETWIAEKKKIGAIGQIGFSFHGSAEEFVKLLAAYPWEFCQIQYNYSDEHFQAGVRGLKKAAETMPVIIMEPLLGGRLAHNLPRAAREIFAKAPGNVAGGTYSPAAWGFRWLWNQPEVTVVLSGMNDTAQVEENAALAASCGAGSLTTEELALYGRVKDVFNAAHKIPCTGCAYCMPCPRNVNIPGCLAAYNTSFVMNKRAGMHQYIMSTGMVSVKSSGPENCIACGKCETRCPQKIKIVEGLRQVRGRFEPFPLNIAVKAVRGVMKFIKRR
jgi:predicted aldo/keto reductase-like oxidoreductase